VIDSLRASTLLLRTLSGAFLGVAYFASPAQAAFEFKHSSVRASALGNAFMASAHEPAALFLNPAGITRLSAPEITISYGKPFAGLPQTDLSVGHLAAVLPAGHGHIGLGAAAFHAPGALQERTLAVGYGVNIFPGLQAALSLKHLSHVYLIGNDPLAAKDPLFQRGREDSALAWDAGVIASLGPYVKAGAACRNINQPDVGIAARDTVPREIQAGVQMLFPGMALRAVGDLLVLRNGVSPGPMVTPLAGLEKGFANDRFALRLGANTREFAAGFGLRAASVRVDYGLVVNRVLASDNAGSHRMAVTYRFYQRTP
jgi:hypothetical protein